MIGYSLEELLTDHDSKLPAQSGLGGYPIIYFDRDNCTLCAACAQETLEYEADDNQKVTEFDVYYEGPSIFCEGCNKEIESAYGDPWAEEAVEEVTA